MERITSRKNPIVAELRRLAGDRGARRGTGLMLVQGHKLLAEALQNGLTPLTLLYSGEAPQLPTGTRAIPVSEELLAWVSPMKSAPELLFTLPIPADSGTIGGRILYAEELQDPGNVGTLMRTAAAFGFDGVILGGASADPWGPKALRAAMGATFRIKIWERPDAAAALAQLRDGHIPIYAAALQGATETAGKLRFPSSFALAIGNEGHGLSSETLAAADIILRIPMAPGAESLNAAAAAAVLMWEAYRERDEHV